MICNFVRIGMQLVYVRLLKLVKMGNQPPNGPFCYCFVCCLSDSQFKIKVV